MWAKPLGLARKGRKLAWDGKRRADRRRNAGNGGEGASERASERKGREEGEGRREREKKDAHGCRWETNDRRPTEDTSKLLHGVAVPPLFTRVPHSRV